MEEITTDGCDEEEAGTYDFSRQPTAPYENLKISALYYRGAVQRDVGPVSGRHHDFP